MKPLKSKSKTAASIPQPSEPAIPYHSVHDSRMWLVEEAAAGISATTINDLIGFTSLSKEFFAGILNISTKTLSRYLVQRKKLNPANSEILLKMKQVYVKGRELFMTPDAFEAYVETPSPGLQNRIPKELMQTSTGIDLVMEELIRIEYGYPV
jgi:putative toxin-antitoxin system antitoxin component (TIGR02293 family)